MDRYQTTRDKGENLQAEIEKKLSVDYGYMLSGEIDGLDARNRAARQEGKSLLWRDRAENLAEAYAKLYDEVWQGYEDGSRKIKMEIAGRHGVSHTLSRDEELNALDDAYEQAVKSFEEQVKKQQRERDRFIEHARQVAGVRGGRNSALASAYLQEHSEVQESVPENLADDMLSARDVWEAAYLDSSKEEAWRETVAFIADMFHPGD